MIDFCKKYRTRGGEDVVLFAHLTDEDGDAPHVTEGGESTTPEEIGKAAMRAIGA